MRELVFLKLGGSLITDKNQRYTPRLDRLAKLAQEIRAALALLPDMRLILGHGSGSYGHFAAKEHLEPHRWTDEHRQRAGVNSLYWAGYSEVSYRAAELNRHVMDALHKAGVPAISLAPSATAQASGGAIAHWDLGSLEAAMAAALLPVIFGDIVFDNVRGSTVLSTEALMTYLATRLLPNRILLAGIEAAVWADFPARTKPIHRITPSSFEEIQKSVGGSEGTDVTGGMRDKVGQMLALLPLVPGLQVRILSGEADGSILDALAGGTDGTVIVSD